MKTRPIEGPVDEAVLARFWVKTAPSTNSDYPDCIVWTAAKLPHPNYPDDRHYDTGLFRFNGRNVLAHRFALYVHLGCTDPGPTVDHLCKNPICCNPDHLRGCPQAENNRTRGPVIAEHCSNGHLRTKENTGIRKDSGKRFCRVCTREIDKRRYQAKYAKEKEKKTNSSDMKDFARNPKLSFQVAQEIREKFSSGFSQRSLAIEYSISPTMVRYIVTGKSWKGIDSDSNAG